MSSLKYALMYLCGGGANMLEVVRVCCIGMPRNGGCVTPHHPTGRIGGISVGVCEAKLTPCTGGGERALIEELGAFPTVILVEFFAQRREAGYIHESNGTRKFVVLGRIWRHWIGIIGVAKDYLRGRIAREETQLQLKLLFLAGGSRGCRRHALEGAPALSCLELG